MGDKQLKGEEVVPENTYYVQRIMPPSGGRATPIFSPIGLTKKADGILGKILRFDYMGATEFELGSVPGALQRIEAYSNAGKAVTGTVKLKKDVYYICQKDLEQHVEEMIKEIAENKKHLKEPAFLPEVLAETDDYAERYCGWLELDNGFMFFTDKTMYEKTLELFEITETTKP